MVCARSSLDLVPEVVVSESVFGILVVKERKDEWRRKRFCEGRIQLYNLTSKSEKNGHVLGLEKSSFLSPLHHDV